MLPLIATLYVYPRVKTDTVPLMLLMGFVSALWASSLGTRLGEWFRPVAAEAVVVPRGALRGTAIALAAAVGFMAWFIGTATPPV
jgi:hypothetical protein